MALKLSTLCLSLFGTSAVFTLASVDPVHVPIVRRTTTRGLNLNEEAFRLRQRYGKTNTAVRTSGTGRRGAVADVPIINLFHNNTGYLGIISVGTPPQTFNVILDTGSSDIWLAGDHCSQCAIETPLFKPGSSSSFTSVGARDISIEFGIGSVAGSTGSDTVQMGELKIDGQTFINADVVSDIPIGEFSGLLGLAFQGIAQTHAPPFWQALIATNQLSAPEFGMYLQRAEKTDTQQTDKPGGVLTFGGTNQTLFSGDIEFVNMPSSTSTGEAGTFWLLSLTDLSLNGNKIAISTGNTAAIDTGTTLIAGPTADVEAFWQAVPNSAPAGQGYFTFPCGQTLSVSMSFGGKSWPINSDDMNAGPDPADNTRCIGAIFDISGGFSSAATGDGSGPDWVIGDTFLKRILCLRADPPSIGFASLSTTNTASSATITGGSDPANTGSAPSTTSTVSQGPDSSQGAKKSAALTTSTPMLLSILSLLIGSVLFASL